jgi:hypothetical protein
MLKNGRFRMILRACEQHIQTSTAKTNQKGALRFGMAIEVALRKLSYEILNNFCICHHSSDVSQFSLPGAKEKDPGRCWSRPEILQ